MQKGEIHRPDLKTPKYKLIQLNTSVIKKCQQFCEVNGWRSVIKSIDFEE